MLLRASSALLKKASKVLITLSLVGLSSHTLAASSDGVPASIASHAVSVFNADKLGKKINETLGLGVIDVSESSFPGVAEIITDRGLFYASYDGKYLIQGTMFGLEQDRVSNLTEVTMSKMRLKGVSKFDNEMITFKAKEEKHVITVFTDITCGYCRKLHEQMDDYNDLGITVRYLAYPRAGIMDRAGKYTDGFKDLRSIWCHEDPRTAMTKAKQGMGVAQRICDKPLEETFNFARQIGVNATPAIILADGTLRPGYVPPENLIQILESM